MSIFAAARNSYHAALLAEGVLAMNESGVASNADGSSNSSVTIGRGLYSQLSPPSALGTRLSGQHAGSAFERLTRNFIESTFSRLSHLRPGKWTCNPAQRRISYFEQYEHLDAIALLTKEHSEAAVLIGHHSDYAIKPDIIIGRALEDDDFINQSEPLISDGVAQRASLRSAVSKAPLLHASVSCKWTLRSDRAQNARSEALNLIRNRKGRVPHIVVVTGEPLPSRLASLVLGTGDIDCVYHFALPELLSAVEATGADDSINLMKIMTDGKRLKDIADLPLDLAV